MCRLRVEKHRFLVILSKWLVPKRFSYVVKACTVDDLQDTIITVDENKFEGKCKQQLSLRMRKSTIRICENKDADQLCSNCTADQRLCFLHTDSTIIFYCPKFQASSGNQNCCCPHAQAQLNSYLPSFKSIESHGES